MEKKKIEDKMVKRNYFILPAQDRHIKKLAKGEITDSSIVRMIIQSHIEKQ